MDSPVERGASAPPAGSAWGSLPLVALIASIGLLVMAVAFSNARLAAPEADAVYWAGLLLIIVPIALAILRPDRARSERVGLVILLGLATYVAKILHSPSYFTLLDEFLHLRTAQDIIDTGLLFLPNPLLVVSPLYPGLELATSGVAQLTGLSAFDVGVAIVGFARLLLMLSLFAVFEEASGSARVASIAALIYASNPNFGVFDSQFAYESLALPLAIASIYAVVRWQRAELHRRRYLVLALVTITGVVVTHHLTSFVLIGFLAMWTVVAAIVGPRRAWHPPAFAFLFAATTAVFWVLTVASETIRYLAPRVRDSLELFRLIIGQSTQRGIFETTTGYTTPDWERIIALASTGILLVLLPPGILRVWQMRPRQSLAAVLALGSLTFPASLALRLTRHGAEESTRTPEFIFLAVGFVAAMAIVRLRLPEIRFAVLVRQPLLAAIVAVVFIGGIVIGLPRWARLPGPYLPAADTRSIESRGRMAALWMHEFLGPGNRIAADRINRNLMGSEGRQYPVTSYGDQIDTWRLFYTPRVDETDQAIIRDGQIEVVVTDDRTTTALPLTRVYFENGEPGLYDRKEPLNPRFLAKWDQIEGVSRFFDDGAIHFYNVDRIRNAD
jgi:hypothetical protein